MESQTEKRTGSVVFILSMMLMVISGRVSGDTGVGTIRIQDDLTVTIRRSVAETETPVALSPGHYNLDHWIIRRHDPNGCLWTCEGVIPEDNPYIDVIAGHEIELGIGEPILSVLTAKKWESTVFFDHSFQGRSGEAVGIERDGMRPPPVLKITNADRSYEMRLTFKYG